MGPSSATRQLVTSAGIFLPLPQGCVRGEEQPNREKVKEDPRKRGEAENVLTRVPLSLN